MKGGEIGEKLRKWGKMGKYGGNCGQKWVKLGEKRGK